MLRRLLEQNARGVRRCHTAQKRGFAASAAPTGCGMRRTCWLR